MEGVRPVAAVAGGLWPVATSAKCAVGSGSTPPRNALFLLGQLSSLTDETACLLPLSFTLNQPPPAKGEPPALGWEGQRMIAKRQKFTS